MQRADENGFSHTRVFRRTSREGTPYRGLCRVLMTLPSASTTVRLRTQSFMVPYRTAFVPLWFFDQHQFRNLLMQRAAAAGGAASRTARMTASQYLQLVPTIPPILACQDGQRERSAMLRPGPRVKPAETRLQPPTDGPGSTGKNSPDSVSLSLSSIHDTAGWTTMSILFGTSRLSLAPRMASHDVISSTRTEPRT